VLGRPNTLEAREQFGLLRLKLFIGEDASLAELS
jgi:hypothetical protein